MHRLSKSRFIAGRRCQRRLWMLVNQPEAARGQTPAEEHRMQVGIEFGRIVTELFPGGVEITPDHRHPQQALDATTAELCGSAPALFEAAFLHRGVLVRTDILKRSESSPNVWHLIEAKSASNSASDLAARKRKVTRYLDDLALQLFVLEGPGLEVASVSLAWINSAYRRRGAFDLEQFVEIQEHSELVRQRATQIGAQVDAFFEMLERPEKPAALFGKSLCGQCEFNQVCWGHEPEDSIIHLPNLRANKLAELRELGVARIPEIPADFKLSKSQLPAVEAYDYPTGKLAQRSKLENWLASLNYPLYYFDFETWNPCIPPFDETWPYIQIPFQYSIHIQDEPDGPTRHREFLAEPGGDSRPELIEHLLADIGPRGSIVVHHADFESRRIRELADFSPAHAVPLSAMLERIVDTEVPFKGNWYLHPRLKGRSSIKVVLPTLAPELSYEGLEIADGLTAASQFHAMQTGALAGDEAAKTCQDLREYCGLDTLAMVKVVERLRALME